MLLYGGCASGFGPCLLGDLRAFDLVSEQKARRRLRLRASITAHFLIQGRDRMILFGGSGRGSFSDTWEYNPGLRQWRETVLEGPAPSARFRHESAYGEGITYFFGGSTEQGLTNELWQSGPRQAATIGISAAVNAFVGSTGAVVPEGLTGAAEARLVVEGASAAVTLPVAAARVGLFPRVWNQDGRVNAPALPARPEEIVVLYATGHGGAMGAEVTVGGEAVPVGDRVTGSMATLLVAVRP